MWSAISNSVRNKRPSSQYSCGNTGALMALSMIRLKSAGRQPPCHCRAFPSTNPQGVSNVLLTWVRMCGGMPMKSVALCVEGTSYAVTGWISNARASAC